MDRVHAAVAAAVDGRRAPGDILRSLAGRFREADVTAAMRELATLGFFRLGEPVRWTTPELARVVPSFLALIEDRFDLFEMPLPDSPAFFFAAAPRADADHLLPEAARRASGRGAAACGFTRADALLRCLGEAAELVASCWHGDEPVEIASYNEVRERAIAPNDLMGYGEQQYAERDAWNAVHGEYDRIPPPLDPDTPIAWTPARDLASHEPVLIPAAYAFIGFRDAGLDEPFHVADSNGCAVGASEEDAIERGFLEIVERDATGLWWYGKRRCPAVHEADIEAAGIGNALDWHRGSRRSLWFLDITSDIDIPVAVAVSANPGGSHVMLGFGAHYEMPRAVTKAMAELVQMEMGLAMMDAGAGPQDALDALPAGLRHWIGSVALSANPCLCGDGEARTPTPPATERRSVPAWCEEHHLAAAVMRGNSTAGAMSAVRVALSGSAHCRFRAAALRRRTGQNRADAPAMPLTDVVPLSI